MEPAKIDWKNIDSTFVKDDLYENINAPKWVDFSAPEDSVNDEAWFCRPDCKHPKTVEDFYKSTPPSKRHGSGNNCEILPLGDRNRREANLKRRGLAQPSISSNNDHRFNEDSENQNPNFSTPPNHHGKLFKATIKSSTEKKKLPIDNSISSVQKDEAPRLKSTLSAKNLFAGRDILNQITEFCSELKKMATRTRERENAEKSSVKKTQIIKKDLDDSDGSNKERKPLLEGCREESQVLLEKSSGKEKQIRKKRTDEAENIPPVHIDLKNIKHKEGERLMPIRTNPPSPQCFSAVRGSSKTTPSRSRLMERGILQEVEQSKTKEVKKEELLDKTANGRSASIVTEKEARTTPLDVFWFLKPCTLSS